VERARGRESCTTRPCRASRQFDSGWRPRATGGPGVWEEAVGAAIGQLESYMAGLRALISDLRPPTLDQLGARAAIEALAERVSGSGLNVDVHVDLAYESGRVTQRPTPELEITMYRIVQEALTNAVKNGGAARGVVEVIEG
jgi:signal transduction histidine kinase